MEKYFKIKVILIIMIMQLKKQNQNLLKSTTILEAILQKMHDEIRRDMILMGCRSVKDLNKSKIIYRK